MMDSGLNHFSAIMRNEVQVPPVVVISMGGKPKQKDLRLTL